MTLPSPSLFQSGCGFAALQCPESEVRTIVQQAPLRGSSLRSQLRTLANFRTATLVLLRAAAAGRPEQVEQEPDRQDHHGADHETGHRPGQSATRQVLDPIKRKAEL